MKKLFIFMIAATFILGLSSIAMAGAVGGGISSSGSPHNFTDGLGNDDDGNKVTVSETWNTTQEICRVCHIPHDHKRTNFLNSDTGLLWNRETSVATYDMYTQAWGLKIDGNVSSTPDGIAKLCLGCHDGTVALDAFNGNTPASGMIQDIYEGHFQVVSQTGNPGQLNQLDMRGTHPVSITYGDDDQFNPTDTPMGSYGDIASVLDNGKVQCSSCHDVHDQEAVIGTNLLRVAQTVADGGTASGLCLTCHKK